MMKKKLRSRSGETLVEVLCAILIVTISVTMLYSLLMSAAGISKRSKELSAKYAVEQDAAQNGGGTTQGTVKVDGQSVTVIYTGSGDELTSYRVAKGG